MAKQYKIQVRLEGRRPIMFDRYPGDNGTSLPVESKFYLDGDVISVPDVNLFSLLTAENTKSTLRLFYPPKMAGTFRNAVNSFLTIEPRMIPLLDEAGNPIRFSGAFGDKIFVHNSVARLAKGVPNPKERPVVRDPWCLDLTLGWLENKSVTLGALEAMFTSAGRVGLGTFRPMFGQFVVTRFEDTEVG